MFGMTARASCWALDLRWLCSRWVTDHAPSAAEAAELEEYFQKNPHLLQEAFSSYPSPLHAAVEMQRGAHAVTIVMALLTACPQCAKQVNQDGQLPLHLAAQYQNGEHGVAIVAALLAANPEAAHAEDKEERTPLHIAAAEQSGEHGAAIVRTLLTACPHAATVTDIRGWLPLHHAATNQKGKHGVAIATALLAAFPRGAGQKNYQGRLPHDYAATNSYLPVECKLLLKKAAERPRQPINKTVAREVQRTCNMTLNTFVFVHHFFLHQIFFFAAFSSLFLCRQSVRANVAGCLYVYVLLCVLFAAMRISLPLYLCIYSF